MNISTFNDLNSVANFIRGKLDTKKYIVLFAYNGTGKTRLSMEFKDLGRDGESRDTLYFNAFTEDLFYWDNDLRSDSDRVLLMNVNSRFFNGLRDLEMENRIRPLLRRYADFDFFINYEKGNITFVREVSVGGTTRTEENIKVSRGEENIFVWCFFLAIAQLAIDGQESYNWVRYIYIDDPISSLDDNNTIAVASHLAQLLKDQGGEIRVVISSHHALFFNVMWNELNERKNSPLQPYFLSKNQSDNTYNLKYESSTPFFHHVALLTQLHQAAESGELYTYHFNILRSILEKTAVFHGFNNFSACIKQDKDDPEGILHARIINILSHGNYSMFEPMEMQEENKGYFRKILSDFMGNYRFNPNLFPKPTAEINE